MATPFSANPSPTAPRARASISRMTAPPPTMRATPTPGQTPPTTSPPSSPPPLCPGGSVTLTASAGATYQWRNFGTPLVGSTSQQLVVTTGGSYTVTVANAAGCSATSSPTSVTVNSVVNVTISGPTTFCTGGNVTLTANPSGVRGTFSAYPWAFTGSPIRREHPRP